MEDDDSGSDDSGSEGGRDEHSSDESDDEEVGAMGTHVADEGAVPAVGEDGGVDVDYFTTLLQQGERYLVLAPGVERAGSGAGARDVSDRAGIGVLALTGSCGQTAGANADDVAGRATGPPAGPAAGLDAEFRLLSESLPGDRFTYRNVRTVAASELSGFRFVGVLDSLTAPLEVLVRECCSADAVFAAAMGLLQPQQGTLLFGVLHGCTTAARWAVVQQLLDAREQRETQQPSAQGIQVSGTHGMTRWSTCMRSSPDANQINEDVARAEHMLLACAVALRNPQYASGNRRDVTLPALHGWVGVAALYLQRFEAFVGTLLGAAVSAPLVSRIKQCRLPRAKQVAAEKAHVPQLYVEAEAARKRAAARGGFRREKIQAEAAREIAELKANGMFCHESQGFDELQGLAAFASICQTRWRAICTHAEKGCSQAEELRAYTRY
jgi:hypothetical protein